MWRSAAPRWGGSSTRRLRFDPVRHVVYLTEDEPDGCLYRFRPAVWPELSVGVLEVLTTATTWQRVPDPEAVTTRTGRQVVGAQAFRGGEGAWYADGSCWFTTKGDGRVWRYDAEHGQLRTVYDAAVSGGSLSGADNVTGFGVGELFVVQDGGDLQVCVLSPHGQVSPFLQLVGHDASEVTGPTLSPDGRRLYDPSQRDTTGRSSGGMTFQVSGPFRRGASSMPGLRDRR